MTRDGKGRPQAATQSLAKNSAASARPNAHALLRHAVAEGNVEVASLVRWLLDGAQ